MISPRTFAAALFASGLAVGTISDRAPAVSTVRRGGYAVLQADFHVHAFLGDGALWPWDVAIEARRRGLDAIALTNHNQVLAARIGHAIARRMDGPLVLVGEEITAPRYHLIAVGIHETIQPEGEPARTIGKVHAQGGAAIAAHPTRLMASAYDEAALRVLDGAEVSHPLAYRDGPEELRSFFEKLRAVQSHAAAVGSSDYHVFGALGVRRTFVFAEERSEEAVVKALRLGRTVAYDTEGVPHGPKELIALLGPEPAPLADPPGVALLAKAGVLCALLGTVGFLLFAPSKRAGA